MKQREIKFRAFIDWDEDNPVMEYFTLYERVRQYCSDDKYVMQFTGLLDKNGKEVFEGDVVKTDSPAHVSPTVKEVIFANGAFQVKLGDWAIPLLAVLDGGTIEVIGNIHLNPELL